MKAIEKAMTAKDGSKVILKSPEASDAENLIHLMRSVSGSCHFMARNEDEVKISTADEEKWIEDMNSSPRSFMISAYIGETMVGNISVTELRNLRKLRHRASFGMAVQPQFQSIGIGKALLGYALETARLAGFHQVEGDAFSDNEKALDLYGKLGFETIGRVPDAFRLDDGTFRDAVMIIRKL